MPEDQLQLDAVPSDDAFLDQAVRYLDNSLSSDEVTAFHAAMESDRAKARLFIDTCLMGKLFSESLGPGLTGESAVVDEGEEHSPATPPFVIPSPFSPLPSALPAQLSLGWPAAYLIATMIVGIGLLIGTLVHVSQPEQAVGRSPASALQPLASEVEYVGRITGTFDCGWNGSSRLSLGQKLELASGLMEITYSTGAKVILQGPVAYEVASKNGGLLSLGKLTGKVEAKQAKGFSINTPNAVVTDLGTEFGVEVGSDGATDAQVFAGEVQIAKLDRQDGDNTQTRLLRAGQSAHVGTSITVSSDRQDFDTRAERFVRALSGGLPTNDAYANLVLSMNPVAYYRMDQWTETDTKDRYVLVDSAPGGHHGVMQLDPAYGRQASRGKFGRALNLHGRMATDYAFVKNYPKTETGQLAVSAWVWAFSVDAWRAVVGNWYYSAGQSPNVGQFMFGLGQFQQLEAGIWQPDGKPVTVSEHGRMLPRSQWQHVAFVADGAVLHLYRNGVEVDTAPYNGIGRPAFPQCLSIGCHMDKDVVAPRLGDGFVWDGRLDEIAIFNHAITREQVRQLSAGQPAAAKGENSR